MSNVFHVILLQCLSSPRALEPVDQVQPCLIERNKSQIPRTALIISRSIKERDPRSVGNEGGLGTAWTVCIPGETAFLTQQPTHTSLHIAVNQLQHMPLLGEVGMWGPGVLCRSVVGTEGRKQ